MGPARATVNGAGPPRFTVLVAFDTPSAVRRRQFTRLLRRYGERVQRSVFEVSVTARELDTLWDQIARLARVDEDAVLAGRVLPGGVRWLGVGGEGPGGLLLLAL